MATIDEVVEALRSALDDVPDATLGDAQTHIDDAQSLCLQSAEACGKAIQDVMRITSGHPAAEPITSALASAQDAALKALAAMTTSAVSVSDAATNLRTAIESVPDAAAAIGSMGR